jgi:hypothetical protein
MIREALMSALMKNKGGEMEDTVEETSEMPDVQKIKSDWNSFLSWMEKKGVKGKPELDKGDTGNKYFKQYIAENPGTSLNESVIPIIRQEYVKLRDDGVKNILEGKGVFSLPGVGNLQGDKAKPYIDRYMGHILNNERSEHPNYVGQHLTQTYFPPATLNIEEDGKLVGQKKLDTYTVEERNKLYQSKNPQSATKVASIPSKNTPIANVQKQ